MSAPNNIERNVRKVSTTESNSFSIVETFRTFRSMLLGADIHVYTYHKNLTYNTLIMKCVSRWRLFIEDFYPTFHYIKGGDNVIADMLSRLPQFDDSITETELISPNVTFNDNTEIFSIELDNDTLLESLLHHPNLPDEIIFPLEYTLLRSRQLQDISLLQQQQMNPQKYPTITLDGIDLICYVTILIYPVVVDYVIRYIPMEI